MGRVWANLLNYPQDTVLSGQGLCTPDQAGP